MAKKLSSKQKKEELNKLFAQYNKRLGRLYSDYVKKLASLGYGEDVLEGDALFNFDNFPELKARLDDIFANYFTDSVLCFKQGMTDGVALAFSQDTGELGGFSVLSDKSIKALRNATATAFISSRLKTEKGLNLSQRIWNYCQQTKSEFEMAMSNVIADGIKGGTSAEEIARNIKQYLNDPDRMYRRYHTVKVLKNGKKKDVVTWRRRRVIDGKVRFAEEPLENVGAGVYRSSRMNALRVARTEINAAYLRGHNARWAKEPFVIGQWIHRSSQHKIEDICDELEGRYPKDFVFSNWHPQCLCTADPIMIEGEERKQFYDRLYAGEDMSNYVSPNNIDDVPDNYRQYITGNEGKIIAAFKNDKLAWHLADNKQYWQKFCSEESQKLMGLETMSAKERIMQAAKKRHEQRTQEQIDHIQSRWNKHRRDYYNGLVDGVTGGKPVDSYKSKDLYERYYAIREAIKGKKSVSDVGELFERFKQGYETKLAWTDRKVAMNVMKVAQNYGETDITGVANALKSADYALAKQEAKALAKSIKAIQNDEASLSALIPDANKWHKQFTSAQLHGVYDAVENKLTQWSSLTLEQQQKKLKFEAYDFLGGNMHGVQQKYATWQVSQAAYIKKLNEVTDAIDIDNISKSFVSDIKSFKTQSKAYHKLVYDLEYAINTSDKALAQQLYDEANAKKQEILSKRTKKTVKDKGSIPFDSEAYSQARKKAALWARNMDEGDDYFRPFAEADWKRWTQNEKEVSFNYTSGSSYINEPLYKKYESTKFGVNGEIRNSWEDINTLSDMIEKSTPFTRDVWLNRGASTDEFFGQFGEKLEFDYEKERKCVNLRRLIEHEYNIMSLATPEAKVALQKEIDKLQKKLATYESKIVTTDVASVLNSEGVQKPFMSTAHTKGYGFVGDGENDVTSNCVYNIYCPKGTKGIYTEPYSDYGKLGSNGYRWDGKSGKHQYGANTELEVVLQRGTRLRVTKIERTWNNGEYRWFIDMEIIEQPTPIPGVP